MKNLPTSPVSTPGATSPPFGPIDPLIVGLRLDAAGHALDEATELSLADKHDAARDLIGAARAVITELSRSQKQEADRRSHEARGDAAVMAAIGTPAQRGDRGLTPTGGMAPMPPLSGYAHLIEDAMKDRKLVPLRARARSWFSWGHFAFIVALALLIAFCVAIGGASDAHAAYSPAATGSRFAWTFEGRCCVTGYGTVYYNGAKL